MCSKRLIEYENLIGHYPGKSPVEVARSISDFEATISKNGQVTLPRAVMDALALKDGDKVRYVTLDEGVLMMPVRPTSCLFGSLKYDGPALSLEDMERGIAEGAVEGGVHLLKREIREQENDNNETSVEIHRNSMGVPTRLRRHRARSQHRTRRRQAGGRSAHLHDDSTLNTGSNRAGHRHNLALGAATHHLG